VPPLKGVLLSGLVDIGPSRDFRNAQLPPSEQYSDFRNSVPLFHIPEAGNPQSAQILSPETANYPHPISYQPPSTQSADNIEEDIFEYYTNGVQMVEKMVSQYLSGKDKVIMEQSQEIARLTVECLVLIIFTISN